MREPFLGSPHFPDIARRSDAMSSFAIRPPVHLRDGHAIDSLTEAAALVRDHATAHCSLVASDLCRRLETIETLDEAQRLALEFRAWAAREGLLLSRPRKAAIAARPLRHQ
jgi:hypothetical protein